MKKKIFEIGKHSDTGFEFVCFEEKAIWGINSKKEYKCFAKKYYEVREIDDTSITADDSFWY